MRALSLVLFLAIACDSSAQDLDALVKTAETASSEWETLAKGLEVKISTLLPCDPKSRAAVEEVSKASEARLEALTAYGKGAAAKAKADTDAAKRVLAAQSALSGGWNTERTEADQERATIEAQVADLKESMRKRGSLAGAEQVLAELANMVKQRGANAEDLASRKDLIDAFLGDLIVAYQARQKAFENESALLDAESAKWKAYYAARVARAVMECAIINPGAAAQGKKQQ